MDTCHVQRYGQGAGCLRHQRTLAPLISALHQRGIFFAAHALTDLERATASSKLSRRSHNQGATRLRPRRRADVSGSIAANEPPKLTVAIGNFNRPCRARGRQNRVRLRGARESAAPVPLDGPVHLTVNKLGSLAK